MDPVSPVGIDAVLEHMFEACAHSQADEFIPVKRGFRIHGHSTTISLEHAFWAVLEEMSRESAVPLPRLIERVHDGCLVSNKKNIASCLRVVCLKYLNVYGGDMLAVSAAVERVA